MDPFNPKSGEQDQRSVQRPLTPSLMARRAFQIQADEGLYSVPVYKPTGIADESDPIVTSPNTSSSHKGRARAGTLPSSWGDALPPFHISPSLHEPPTDFSTTFRTESTASTLPELAVPLSSSPGNAPLTTDSAQRIRSGSLSIPSANLGNAFGPTFFSSNWQPSRSGLSNVATAEEEQAASSSNTDEAAGQDAFDAPDTLDYLGLADASGRRTSQNPDESEDQAQQDEDLAFNSSRNRAFTISTQLQRPKLATADGRSRSSSFLPPSFRVGSASDASPKYVAPRPSALSTVPSSHAAGQSLLTAALHHRMNQSNPIHNGEATELPTSNVGARPRATSMGIMDRQQHASSSDPLDASSQYSDADRHILPGSGGYAGANLRAVAESEAMSLLSSGRNRAGTIAAFSGPGGRQRTEQELLRMTYMQNEASDNRFRPVRPSSAGVLDQASAQYDSIGPRAPVKPQVSLSGSTSPFFQPTRSLYVGLLRSNVTTQELLQLFSRYGAVETFRFVPDKECAFINYVEIADAIRAKDDVNIRLGGRVGLGSTASDGYVRVKFGRPDSAPLASPVGGPFAPVHESFGNPDLSASEAGAGLCNELTDSTPTRALWIGSIPAATSIETLVSIFAPFGPIESVRVLSGKNCGFVNFERLDDAIIARKALHGRDVLGPDVGAVRIGFAKVPNRASDGLGATFDPYSSDSHTAIEMLSGLQGAGAVPAEMQLLNGHLEDYRSNLALDALARHASHPGLTRNLSHDSARGALSNASARSSGFPAHSASNSIVPSSDRGGVPLPAEMKPRATVTDLQLLMQQLDESDPNVAADIELVAKPRPLTSYYTRIPSVAEAPVGKSPDNNGRLKEARKRLESPSCSQMEADTLGREFLGTIVELSSDFIGNTLVQKFFEKCGEPMKGAMLTRIGPHLATIGVHKNGTWAAQKIIDCTQAEDQRALVVQHLRPYVPPLLLDQYGNYVVQKLLPFGSPYCDFIFDAMVDRCWEVAQGRFGARSMRTCLETVGLPKAQIKRVAISIILNSVPLATSQNGALLITWLLDASGLPGRFRLIAPRLTPHLAHLCTHKLASQTIHRIISQRIDPDASHMILRALLDSSRPQLLEEVLIDQVHGSQFITKLMLDPQLLDPAQRERFSDEVRKMLVRHKLTHVPPYKPLAVSLGLLSANAATSVSSEMHAGMGARGPFDSSAQLERHLSHMSLENSEANALSSSVAPGFDSWSGRGSASVLNGRTQRGGAYAAASHQGGQTQHSGLSASNGHFSDFGYLAAPGYTNPPTYHQHPTSQQQHLHSQQQQQHQSFPRRHSPLIQSSKTTFGN